MKLTKQQKNCPYCHGTNPDYFPGEFGWVGVIREFDKRLIAVGPDKDAFITNINFCPQCGRPLNEEEE